MSFALTEMLQPAVAIAELHKVNRNWLKISLNVTLTSALILIWFLATLAATKIAQLKACHFSEHDSVNTRIGAGHLLCTEAIDVKYPHLFNDRALARLAST